MKMGKTKRREAVRSRARFHESFEAYLTMCMQKRRIPNAAGFCRFAKIKREELYALRECYPLEYDLLESAFIDEALNMKVPNSGTTMSYLRSLTSPEEERDSGAVTIFCEHDGEADGE